MNKLRTLFRQINFILIYILFVYSFEYLLTILPVPSFFETLFYDIGEPIYKFFFSLVLFGFLYGIYYLILTKNIKFAFTQSMGTYVYFMLFMFLFSFAFHFVFDPHLSTRNADRLIIEYQSEIKTNYKVDLLFYNTNSFPQESTTLFFHNPVYLYAVITEQPSFLLVAEETEETLNPKKYDQIIVFLKEKKVPYKEFIVRHKSKVYTLSYDTFGKINFVLKEF